MKHSIVFGFAGLLTVASGAALAQSSNDDAHAYIGGSYGGFKARGGEFDDEKDLIEATFGGFFNPYFGLEGSATYFGEYGNDLAEAEARGYGLAVMGRVPMSDSWGLYAKAGQFFWEADLDTSLGTVETDGDDPFFAAGTDFRLAPNLNMILEYSRYQIDTEVEDWPGVEDTDLDTVKVGLRLRF